MLDINMIKQVVQQIFQGSGGTLSKQGIVAKAGQVQNGQAALPVLNQLPEKNNFTEQGVLQEVQNIVQKMGGGSIAGKIRSKIGV